MLGFSAAGYFFGRHVHENEGVPVGLIMTAWGGTYAEAWTSKAGLASMPGFEQRLKDTEAHLPKLEQVEADYGTLAQTWEAQMDSLDAGMQNGVAVWGKPDCPVADWKPIDMPLPFTHARRHEPLEAGRSHLAAPRHRAPGVVAGPGPGVESGPGTRNQSGVVQRH